jgi:hypothetical protein
MHAETFVCLICTLVVEEPRKCLTCESVFCLRCLEGWRARPNRDNTDYCPGTCGKSPLVDVDLSLRERRLLDELEFECFKCATPFKF